MRCLRCGWCCHHLSVVIVDDPARGICEDNLEIKPGDGTRCKHLRGDKPGEYACAIHDEPWYGETPCAEYTQIEASPDDDCRTGFFMTDRWSRGKHYRTR